MEDKVQKG